MNQYVSGDNSLGPAQNAWAGHSPQSFIQPYSGGDSTGGVHTVVAPKNPGASLVLSFLVPGVGSMMNGDLAKGAGILVGYLISIVLMLLLIGFLTAPIFWIWGMIDAYQGAQAWNARHGIVS